MKFQKLIDDGLSANCASILRSFIFSEITPITNPHWHGFSGRKRALHSLIRYGFVDYDGKCTWTLTDKGQTKAAELIK